MSSLAYDEESTAWTASSSSICHLLCVYTNLFFGPLHVRQGEQMSDWDFLHDMHNDGYSPEQIADAAACGYNPWEWEPIHEKEFPALHPHDDPELVTIFERLVENARSYYELTGRYLQIWGELGELYAEINYGIKRHKPHTRGSDGKLGNDFVEIKTISPEKDGGQVQVLKFRHWRPALNASGIPAGRKIFRQSAEKT